MDPELMYMMLMMMSNRNILKNFKDISHLFELGHYYGENKDYKRAIDVFDKIIQLTQDPKAWFYKGLALQNLKKIDEAIKCYDNAIKTDPNYSKALNNKGTLLTKISEYDKAIKCFDKALKIDPDYAEVHNNKGLALGYLGRYEEAIKSFNKAINYEPKNIIFLYNKGELLRNLKRYEEAIESYDRIINIKNDFFDAILNKGISLAHLEKYDESIEYFDKLIELNPNSPFIHIVYSNKGLSLGNLERYEEAIKYLDKSIELNSENAEAWFNKGVIFETLGKYDEAIEYYEKALEIAPDLALSYHRISEILRILGKYEEAIKYQDKSIALDSKNAEFWFSKGLSLSDLGRFEESINPFDKALNINPNFSDAYSAKCASLRNLRKNEDALNCINTAIEFNPNSPELWFNKGLSLIDLKRYEESIRCFNEAVTLNHKFALAYNSKGFSLNHLDKFNEAIKCFNRALNIDSTLETAFNNKGISHLALGQYEKALECFNEALRINPYFTEVYVNKGSALGNMEEYNEEIECYDKALELNQYIFEAWYNKGSALSNLGKYNESINCFNQSIEINPNYGEVYNNKGVSFENLGKFNHAIKCFDKALELDSTLFITHVNKGLVLAKIGKYERGIESCNNALKIQSDFAEAYMGKGIIFLTLHKYNDAKYELKIAENIFNEKNELKQAKEAYNYKLLTVNSSNLISELEKLEMEFISCLHFENLDDFRKDVFNVFKGINALLNKSEKVEIPKDLNEFLVNKKICFQFLLDALSFKRVDLERLYNTKMVFENWNIYSVITVNYIDTFIRFLSTYNSEDITLNDEKNLLKILIPLKGISLDSIFSSNLQFFQDKIIEGIETKIKGKTIQKPHLMEKIDKKTATFEYINIDETQKESVRVALVQLDFSLTDKFPYVIEDENKIKEKIFSALKTAKECEVDILCFPELSFCDEWVEIVKKEYNDGMVVCGSFYDENNRNICKIIIDGKEYPIAKCNPAIMEEKNGTGMESGNTINIFQTKYGKIVVFICIDFDRYFFPHINDLNLDFVINPRLDIDKEHRFHKKADIIIDKDDGSREYAFMLQTNAYKTKWGTRNGGGGTAIIGYEHIHRIEKNINWGMRPKKGVKYNLYEVKGELMLITDLKIGPETGRRSKFINWYKYESNQWKALDDNQIWD